MVLKVTPKTPLSEAPGWSFLASPPPWEPIPQIELPTRPLLPKMPAPPSVGLGLARLFAPWTSVGTAGAMASIMAGDSSPAEQEEEPLPPWWPSDLDPETHARLEVERRRSLTAWLEGEKARAWVVGDFLQVNLLQNEIDHLLRALQPPTSRPHGLQIRNSSGDSTLTELASLYGIIPQDLVAEILKSALNGGPVLSALLLRLPILREQTAEGWPEHAHTRLLWALAELSHHEADQVRAVYLLEAETEHRIAVYRRHLRADGKIGSETVARLKSILIAMAILTLLSLGTGTVHRQAEDSLRTLAGRADLPQAVRRQLEGLMANPKTAIQLLQDVTRHKVRAALSLRDLRATLLSNAPPPTDLPSALDESVSPHSELFTAPAGDAEAMLSLLWPAPFDHVMLWDRLLKDFGDDGLFPKYYEEGSMLSPLVDSTRVQDWTPMDIQAGKWSEFSTVGTGFETLYDRVVLGADPQVKEHTAAYLIHITERQPWPAQVLALSQIAIQEPLLAPMVVQALKLILIDATITNRYPRSLAPGAAEAAFDGLMRIARQSGHPRANVAWRALWEVGQDVPRVAVRLRKVRPGNGNGVLSVLRSDKPPHVLK